MESLPVCAGRWCRTWYSDGKSYDSRTKYTGVRERQSRHRCGESHGGYGDNVALAWHSSTRFAVLRWCAIRDTMSHSTGKHVQVIIPTSSPSSPKLSKVFLLVIRRYQWTGNAGTHFWHAHTGLQKIDGLYGSVIVRQPPSRDPNSHLYDFDLTTHIVLISDWLHEDAAERYPGRLAVNTGQDPESMLINGRGQFRDPNTGFMTNTPLEIFTITPGRRYRFRLINAFASVCPAQVTIEGHGMTVIATDGEPVHPVQVNTIISFSGEWWRAHTHVSPN